jgi:ComF family protein
LWQALDFLYGLGCHACGIPLPEATAPESLCGACIAGAPPLTHMRAALAYDDLSKPMVLAMKHAGRKDGVGVFAAWMLEAAPFVRSAHQIMPVPLHWTRLWTRGYNQAAWLAQAVAARSHVTFAPQGLVRKRRTPSQNGLSRAGRARNVAGAFAVTRDVKGQHIVLVDDVFTTGATLYACAKALLRAGAVQVDGVTLTRVVRPSPVELPDDPILSGPSLLETHFD